MAVSSVFRNSSNATNTNSHAGDSRALSYRIKRGDTLNHVAKAHGVSLEKLLQENPQIRNPNRIQPGQEIALPQPATPQASSQTPSSASRSEGATRSSEPSTYTIQRGDTLNGIAHAHGTTAGILKEHNPQIRSIHQIREGDVLNIPGNSNTPREQPARPASDVSAATRFPGLFDPNRFAKPVLSRGSSGEHVRNAQERLAELGYHPGQIDGDFGPQTASAVRSFQRLNNLSPDGVVGSDTWKALQSPDAATRSSALGNSGDVPRLQRYVPFSPEAEALFEKAADIAGVPASWARSSGLHNILQRESDGIVGRPNYTYGSRSRNRASWPGIHDELRAGHISARSSATGLGQLLLNNVERYYPSGRAGIGDPVEEAAGMLSYIKDRYGHPDTAWRLYGTRHEGY